MKLAPIAPPGRVTRKARAFTAEILRLRDEGYTFEAIRAALADAGVHVSSSTVRREVAKTAGLSPAMPPKQPAESDRTEPRQPVLTAAASTGDSPSPVHEQRSQRHGLRSKETAEAFFRLHHSNPLFPPKETS
jgi:hypothetical protein